MDHWLARALPIDDLDEQQLGEALRARYEVDANTGDPDLLYVNELIDALEAYAEKPFDYRAHVLDRPEANALALPGGVVIVTRGLLQSLGSEAELVAVLAHELGHIEREHCFAAVKFELLSRKRGSASLGQVADLAVGVLTRHAFSKTQENDADEYAYTVLLQSPYDPRALGSSFGTLLRSSGSAVASRADPIRDYFLSHPPLEIREARFLERANAWWRRHPGERRYIGALNLSQRRSYANSRYAVEWTPH